MTWAKYNCQSIHLKINCNELLLGVCMPTLHSKECPKLGVESWIGKNKTSAREWVFPGVGGGTEGQKNRTGTTWQRTLCHWWCQRRSPSCCWGKDEVNLLLSKPPWHSSMLLCREWYLLGRAPGGGTHIDIRWHSLNPHHHVRKYKQKTPITILGFKCNKKK